jgi:hypothetical protein
MQYTVYTVLRIYCTQRMKYLAFAVLGVGCTWCMLYLVLTPAYGVEKWEGWRNFVFIGDGRVEDENERDKRRWGKSSSEKGTKENSVYKSICDPQYGRYESQFGMSKYWYVEFATQSGESYT